MDQHNNIWQIAWFLQFWFSDSRSYLHMVMIHWHWSELAQDEDDSHKIQELQSDSILCREERNRMFWAIININ